jgi:predicted O-methyltransferase YrrM
VVKFFQVKSYLNHWLSSVDEHSIHSPFFFDLYNKVIKPIDDLTGFKEIEKTRTQLLQNQSEVSVNDLGAQSKHFKKNKRTIAQVAATSLSPEKITHFIHRLLLYLDTKQIVELGTSMGITTLYMAKKENAFVNTFEGNPSMINIALTNFEYFEAKNINLIEGNIDDTLPKFLQTPMKIDFVLMDANHRYQPTLHYFHLLTKRIADKGVIVVDDIYNSEEMGKVWQKLKNHDLVYGSIDLFRCGILFFDPALNKQHYIWSV